MRLLLIFAIISVFSCSKKISYNYPDNADYARNSRAGKAFSEKDFIVLGDEKSVVTKNSKTTKTQQNVANSKLWKSATEVVSSLFPIAIIDADSGIIASEWYQDNPQSKSRVKVNVLIRNSEIGEKNPRVSVFRQTKSDKNDWQGNGIEDSESSAADALTARLIKEKILEKRANSYLALFPIDIEIYK